MRNGQERSVCHHTTKKSTAFLLVGGLVTVLACQPQAKTEEKTTEITATVTMPIDTASMTVDVDTMMISDSVSSNAGR